MNASINMNVGSNMQDVNAVINNATQYNKEESTMKSNAGKNSKVEAETMQNENNGNEEGKIMTANVKETTDVILNNMVTYITSSDINEIIPEEEKEVLETNHLENIELPTIVKFIEPSGNLIPEIPEKEREEIDEETYIDLKESAKYGCFSPVLGMKGFKLDTGHVFYARIFMDSKGNRCIEYCQQYSNNSCSAKMQVKQADLVIAGLYLLNVEKNKEESLKFLSRNAVNKIIMKARNDYYNKTVFPQECVNIEHIFLLLLTVYNYLPIEKSTLEEYDCPDKLYENVMNVIRKKSSYFNDNEHKAYYACDAEQIDMIADELKMKRDLLLKKLKEYKFLYLTDSSKGYQTCVRFSAGTTKLEAEFLPESYTKWSYCILKLEYLASRLAQRGNESKPCFFTEN